MTKVLVTQTELVNARPRGLTPTQPPGDNSDKFASTAYVDTAIAAVTDYISGLYFIAFGDTKTIPIFKQMITKGNLVLDGVLLIDGQFFLED